MLKDAQLDRARPNCCCPIYVVMAKERMINAQHLAYAKPTVQED